MIGFWTIKRPLVLTATTLMLFGCESAVVEVSAIDGNIPEVEIDETRSRLFVDTDSDDAFIIKGSCDVRNQGLYLGYSSTGLTKISKFDSELIGVTDQDCSDGTFELSVDRSISSEGKGALYIAQIFKFGLSEAKQVNLTIGSDPANNEPPTISSIDSLVIDEDSKADAVVFSISDKDDELECSSDYLTLKSSDQSLVNDADVEFTGVADKCFAIISPQGNAHGTVDLVISVEDGRGGLASSEFSLGITPVADVPEISLITSQSTARDTASSPIAFQITDADGDLNCSADHLSMSSSNESIVANTSVVFSGTYPDCLAVVTPQAAMVGTVSLSFTVTDPEALFSQTTFEFEVFVTNTNPTISNVADQSSEEDTATADIAFVIGDAESSLTCSATNLSMTSSNTTLVANSSVVFSGTAPNCSAVITPALNQHGTTTITLKVMDGDGGFATDSFVLTINSVNDAPVITAISAQSTDEDTTSSPIAFEISDVDSELACNSTFLSYSSSNASVVSATGSVSFAGTAPSCTLTVAPVTNANGITNISVTVDDRGGATASKSFELAVNSVNDAPTMSTIADVSTNKNVDTSAINFNFSDIDSAVTCTGTHLTMTSSNAAVVENGAVVFSGTVPNCSAVITPVAEAVGSTTITISGSDGATGSVSKNFTLTVTEPSNTNPTITTIANQTTDEDVSITSIGFTIGDAEQSLSCNATFLSVATDNADLAGSSEVTFSGTAPNCTADISPVANAFGSAVLTFTVSDGVGGTGSTSFSLTVNSVNDAPVASAGSDSVLEDSANGALSLVFSDVDSTVTSCTVVSSTANGVLSACSCANGVCSMSYTPDSDFFGTDSLTFKVSDGTLESAVATHTINVTNVNDAPTISITSPASMDSIYENFDYNIAFDALDIDNDASISLYYGTTNTGCNIDLVGWTALATGLTEGANVSFLWDTTGIAVGSYYLCAKIDDGIAAAVFSTSTGVLQITAPPPPFVTEWDTENTTGAATGSGVITLPLISAGSYNIRVDWGDGQVDKISAWDDTRKTHSYSTGGTYTVTITGDLHGWSFYDSSSPTDAPKILKVTQWGSFHPGSTNQGIFRGAANLTITATDVPDLSGVTSLSQFFYGCSSLTTVPNMQNWEVSQVTDIGYMFANAPLFNQDIGGWDVSSVTNMSYLFSSATAFNQDLSAWQTIAVTNMSSTFRNAASFNQDLSGWDTSKVTMMSYMFNGATAFNSDISGWNTGNVASFQSMFQNAETFNANIGGWNTAKATTMSTMFMNAKAFDQDLSSWSIPLVTQMPNMFNGAISFNSPPPIVHSGVTTVQSMFQGALVFNQDISNWDTSGLITLMNLFNGALAFNQPITNWDVSNVTNMKYVFYNATAFNHPLNWNTAKVADFMAMFMGATSFNSALNFDTSSALSMASMFNGATAFNQDIRTWNVSSVTNMNAMFSGALSFDQNIGDWDVSGVTNFGSFLGNTGMSTLNYDAMLISWSKLPSLSAGVIMNNSGKTFSQTVAKSQRDFINSTYSWTITDAGVNPDFPVSGAFLSETNLSSSSFTLNWQAASDSFTAPASIQYFICSGPDPESIDTVEECSSSTMVMGYTAGVTSHLVTGVAPGTTYHYNIVSVDGDGNEVIYPGKTVVTP